MQIATWNINSLTVRLPQVLAWLQAQPERKHILKMLHRLGQ